MNRKHILMVLLFFVFLLSVNVCYSRGNKLNLKNSSPFVPPRVTVYATGTGEHHSKQQIIDDVQVSPFGDQFGPKMVVRSTGEIFLSYYTADSVSVWRSTDDGESWQIKLSIFWAARGASVFDLDLTIAEGDSTCLFLSHIIYYNGVDAGELIVYRINLGSGSEGFRYVRQFPSPLVIQSPRIVSDAGDSVKYRVRASWLVKGGAADTVYYANSLDQGWSWSSPIATYIDPSGSVANLAVAYGRGQWWMAFDKSGDIYVRNLFSGTPTNLTRTQQSYYRPVISIARSANSLGRTAMTVAFARRLNQSDVGTYFICSPNGGVNWLPIYSVGGNSPGTRNFNPYVSYSKTLERFYYTFATQDSIGLPSQSYRISSYYATINVPDQLIKISSQVNDDSSYGSSKADPVIVENPAKGGIPMLAWRNWSGSGEGKIMFDILYPTTGVNESSGKHVPADFILGQNYPNPFNPVTTIQYSVSSRQFVTLKVYDLIGREVASLVSGDRLPGTYSADFDASSLASGMYIYRLTAGGREHSMKMILLR